MRAVFSRRRDTLEQIPAFMGGLNYEEIGSVDKKRVKSRLLNWVNDEEHRMSADLASGHSTRVGNVVSDQLAVLFPTPVPAGDFSTRSLSARPVSQGNSRQRSPMDVEYMRPYTAGEGKRRNRQLGFSDASPMPKTARPSTTENKRLSSRASRIRSARDREYDLDQEAVPRHRSATSRISLSISAPRKQAKKIYYTLIAKVVGVKGGDRPQAQEPGQEADTVYNTFVSLTVDGNTHTTKPIKMARSQSISVPEDQYIFEIQGNIHGSLLGVKLMRKFGEMGRDVSPEIGSTYVDLASVVQSGGTQMVDCRLAGEGGAKAAADVQLELKLFTRTSDFQFTYLNEEPQFKKAGYVITPRGIIAFPQPYRKKGLPAGSTIKNLLIKETVREEPQGVTVFRASREDGKGAYTVKRFRVMELDPRQMLVNELDGLLDCPPQQSITLLDAFLDRLEVVLVLDELGGRYLRDVILKKGKVPEQNISIIVRQLLQILRYLHESKLRVHNDVDASNILVLKTGEIRLGGFCYSSRNLGKAQKFAGPYVHMSPERLLGLDCGFASDVWSVGILAMEMTLGTQPYDMSRFQGQSALFEFKKMVVTEPSPSLKRGEEYSDELRLFVDSCLHKNLKLRLTVQNLITHPFVAKFESLQNTYVGKWMLKTKKKTEEETTAAAEAHHEQGGDHSKDNPPDK